MERWIFGRPTPENLARLHQVCAEMPIVDADELRRHLRGKEFGQRCELPLIELVQNLSTWLRDDYAEHVAEAGEAPWMLEYAVDPEGLESKGRFLNARLTSSDPNEGAIVYGCEFYRVGDDKFVYLAD